VYFTFLSDGGPPNVEGPGPGVTYPSTPPSRRAWWAVVTSLRIICLLSLNSACIYLIALPSLTQKH